MYLLPTPPPPSITELVFFRVDLMQLVEDAVDGCWVGHRARTAIMDSGIGSVYSPPKEDQGSPINNRRKLVETVIDIGYRKEASPPFFPHCRCY